MSSYLIANRLHREVFSFGRNVKRGRMIFVALLNDARAELEVNGAKYHSDTKTELSLSNETVRKFVKYVIEKIEKDRSAISEFMNESTYQQVSTLLRSRKSVEESMKSLDDLVKQDPEMKKLGEEEYAAYKNELESLDDEMLNCIYSNLGQETCNDIILEITIGVGGQESMLFARDLLEMYLGYIDYLGFSHELLAKDTSGPGGGIRHASIAISGKNALEMLKHEGGVHRVQRIPSTEKSGRVHTSTVSVAILIQPSDIEVSIKDHELKIDTMKSSGAGGQHVNSTDSAVRITHLPSGIAVECQTDRSQLRNRRIAMMKLRTILYEKQLNEQRTISGEMRKKQFGYGLRNEKIRTYNFNQDRVTDHRIADGTMHNLKGFLEGGEILQQLQFKLQRNTQQKTILDIIQRVIK